MRTDQLPQTNFGHLEIHEPQLVRLGMLAERYFAEDPNTCPLKLRQFAEVLAQITASKVGVFVSDENQYDLLRRLVDHGILPREIAQLFGEVRRAGMRRATRWRVITAPRSPASRSVGSSASGFIAPSKTRASVPVPLSRLVRRPMKPRM